MTCVWTHPGWGRTHVCGNKNSIKVYKGIKDTEIRIRQVKIHRIKTRAHQWTFFNLRGGQEQLISILSWLPFPPYPSSAYVKYLEILFKQQHIHYLAAPVISGGHEQRIERNCEQQQPPHTHWWCDGALSCMCTITCSCLSLRSRRCLMCGLLPKALKPSALLFGFLRWFCHTYLLVFSSLCARIVGSGTLNVIPGSLLHCRYDECTVESLLRRSWK